MADLSFLTVEQARSAGLTWPDVYFTPGYGHACEASDGARWEVAVGASGAILFPFLVRPVPVELSPEGDAFDVVSPYGYAGTSVAPGVGHTEVRAFRQALRDALAERGGLAEFHRVSGLIPGQAAVAEADSGLKFEALHDTVAFDLTQGYDALWAAAEGRARTKTRKSRKKGYTVEHRPAVLDDLLPGGAYRDLYDGTMRRVEAREYYLFPDEYYRRLLDGLGEDLGQITVRGPDGEPGCVGIYFVHGPLLHLHLVGNTRQAQRDGAGNALYDGMIAEGCRRGATTLHVGGGLKPDDSLFFFKKSFGGYRVPFHVARGVLHPERYAAAVALRAEQTDRTVDALTATGYFPAYRG